MIYTAHNIEYYAAQVRRIAEHREAGTEKEIRKLYKSLLNELKKDLGELYANNAGDDGIIDFAKLQRNSRYANFLELAEKRVNGISPKIKKEITDTVENIYKEVYEGLIKAVEKSQNIDELSKALGSIRSVTPETVKRAVQNPISGLTLDDTLEKNRQSVIYDIKQVLNIGLVNNDHISTIAKKLTEKVDMDYRKAICITRTETNRVLNAGDNDAAVEINEILESSDNVDVFMVKTWRTMKDERVRPQQRRKTKKGWKTSYNRFGPNHMKMEGQTVKVNEMFDLGGGVKAMAPLQSGVAGHDINCRCYAEYDLMTAAEFEKVTGLKLPPKEFTAGKNGGIIKENKVVTGHVGTPKESKSDSIHPKQLSLKNLDEFEKWQNDYYKVNSKVSFARKDNMNIYHYSEADYEAVNGLERGGEWLKRVKRHFGDDLTKYERMSAGISKELSKFKLNDDLYLRRSVGEVDFITGATSSIDDMKKAIGKVYTEKGFTSTTVCSDAMLPFGGTKGTKTVLDIIAPKSKTRGAYIYKISDSPAEFEFLIDKNTKFKIVDAGEREIEYVDYKGEARKEKERYMVLEVFG